MLVSVLIPVYNVEKYVETAIRSILEQTYRNIEIIIIDDCSTDLTYEICRRLSMTDHRIRLYRNDVNRKISFTLNRALEYANGELIARMDGDDISELDRIEKTVNFLKSNPLFDLVGCSVIAINSKDEFIGSTTHYSDFEFLKRTLKYVSPCSHIWISRRNVYEKLKGYRNISGAEDYDFLLRAVTSGFRISNLQDYFGYKVRLARTGNTTLTIGARQRLLQRYVLDMYFQRLHKGLDNFSEETMESAVRTSKFSERLYIYSNSFLMNSIQSNGLIMLPKKIIFLFLSLCSPIQAKYIFSRVKYKLICRIHEL